MVEGEMTEQELPEVEEHCDCPGPPAPPQFMVPPPPPPPALQACRAGDTTTHHYCHLEPVGAEYTQAAFPSLPIIAVCSSVVLVAVLVASFLIWKHKKKVQHFLPCKDGHQGRCELSTSNGLTYDDMLINHHPTRLPNSSNPHTLTPIELLDVKYSGFVPGHFGHSNCTFGVKDISGSRGSRNRDHFNPIYEEVSGGSEEKSRSYYSDIDDSEVDRRTVASEDEFAEDELSVAEVPVDVNQLRSDSSSLRGSTGGDLCDSSDSEKRCCEKEEYDCKMQDVTGMKGHAAKSRSLERNKDGHGSEAKQNYYMKKVLSPDFSYSELQEGVAQVTHIPRSTSGSQRDSGLPHSSNSMELDLGQVNSVHNHSSSPSDPSPYGGGMEPQTFAGFFRITTDSPPPPPYTPSGCHRDTAYVSKSARLPDALLAELGQKLGSPYLPPMNRGHTYNPSGRVPTPPPHNFYSCLEEGEGPFTIDGSRHRMMSSGRLRQSETRPCRTGGSFSHRLLMSNKDRARTHISEECDSRTASST